MISLKNLAMAAAVTLTATQAYAADEFAFYETVEGWNIFEDIEKLSCFIEKADSDGNVVQMGLTEDRAVGYLGVFTTQETHIVAGETSEIGILIGDNIYLGESTGMRGNITDGYSGGYILSDDPQFVTDLMQQYEMTVFPESEFAFTINLDGTLKAIEAAKTCNASL
ncbi:hypothetical protein [Falsihalocynthiibacter arcticus]|uniref:Uncharacterized protein n=1 Tax=Falsihalocynthiibacter arcticus TaxID=1579316 RepID=A0A126UVP8_9RHOB|nr:hypothetical protein [Falsihalocynthiibacter arcticus]AML50120.1 hypothetical protein RC74_01450 [Falsihalocynthiibacter arcticus]